MNLQRRNHCRPRLRHFRPCRQAPLSKPLAVLALVAVLCLTLFALNSSAIAAPATTSTGSGSGSNASPALRILFTHDMHSHIEPYQVLDGSTVQTVGGYARLATLIKENRTDHTLVLDAGDFSMGTLYNGIFEQSAPDLKLMAAMGYNATTFGNHEFDYGPQALTQMLSTATTSAPHPLLMLGNIQFGVGADSKNLEAACTAYGAAETHIFTVDGRKIGVFGLLGKDAQSYLADRGTLSFADPITSAKAQVAALKAAGAQTIIALSHSGTIPSDPGSSKSEDVQLAKAVPDIDLIISAHSHTTLQKALVVGHTTIVSAGCYDRYLGVVDFNRAGKVTSYHLQEVTASVPADPTIARMVAGYHAQVQAKVLDPLHLSFNATSAVAPRSFTNFDTVQTTFGDFGLGTLIADSYVREAQAKAPDPESLTTIGVTANGLIRDSITAGPVTTADTFQILSLGRGADGSLGYPLAAFYLTGAELRNLAEVDASVSGIMNNAQLYFSGMRYHYSPQRMFLNRVTDVEVLDGSGKWIPAIADSRYRVVCSLYMAQMAQLIPQKTHGLLSLQPKNAQGKVVSDLNSCILRDSSGTELKEWLALNDYLLSMPKVNGVATIPARYYGDQHTKLVLKTTPGNLLRAPNKVGVLAAAVVCVLLAVIILVIWRIRRARRRRRHKYLFV